jgi:hypothetical protein
MSEAKSSNDDADIWQALTAGELSKEEEALLRALAEESDDDAVKLEAHAPLDEAFRARTVDVLAKQIEGERRKRHNQRARFAYAGVGLAAAAAALFAFLPGNSEALPAYTLAVHGMLAEQRGAEENAANGPLRVLPETELEIALTPAQAVKGEPQLTVGLISQTGVTLAHGTPERAASGAFRLTGPMKQLFDVAPGRYTLAAVVAHAALTPEELAAKVAAHAPEVEQAALIYQNAP